MFSVLSQAASLMDFKTCFAAEALISDHHEREGETADVFSHHLMLFKFCCLVYNTRQVLNGRTLNWDSRLKVFTCCMSAGYSFIHPRSWHE